MKRPLCAISIMVAAAVWLLLMIIQRQEYPVLSDRAEITITGKITGKERKTNSFSGELQTILQVKLSGEDFSVLIYIDSDTEPEIGKTVKVKGVCKAFSEASNPGEFDSRDYYRILKIAYRITDAQIIAQGGNKDIIKEALFDVRMSMEEIIDKCMNDRDAGVMKAVILGDKNSLDDEVKDIYKRNGIIHIIAVSGLHISILGMTLYKLLRKTGIGIIPSCILSVTIMYLYGNLCGMSTSAARAIIMFSMRIFADVVGRTYDMLSALALSAILLIVRQPLYIEHSGFLMSFGAVVAIGYVLPALPRIFREGKFKVFGAGISITLVTLPVYMSFYYTFPVYSIFLNLFILPLMTILMSCGIIMIAAGALFMPVGIAIGMVDHLILKWFLLCCGAGDILPKSTWYTGHSRPWQVGIYIFILFVFAYLSDKNSDIFEKYFAKALKRKYKFNTAKSKRIFFHIRNLLMAIGIFILCLRFHPELRITMLDVGQGDGIIMETKHSRYLIDGGSTSKSDVAKYQIDPFLSYEGIGSLDAVILTHEDEDHMSGILELMEYMGERKGNIQIKNLILPDVSENSRGVNYRRLETEARKLGIPIHYIKRGDHIKDRDMEIECIGPCGGMDTAEPNAYSTVLFVKYGGFKGLFTGDVDGVGQDLLRDYISGNREEFENLTVLKVAHHGSKYTSDEEFLKMVNPKISLISCGKDNRYGHPHKELLDRLIKIDSSVYITAENGAITVDVNRGECKIIPFKKCKKNEY